ncbi:unnamed protein product [Penicillium manginii]
MGKYSYRAQLCCEKCHERKVKCDKLNPCTSCKRIGAVCIQVERARLPRGRTRHARNEQKLGRVELTERLNRLEEVLESMGFLQEEQQISQSPLSSGSPVSTQSNDSQSNDLSFGDTLFYHLHAGSMTNTSSPGTFLSSKVSQQLCRVYQQNVDAIVDGGQYLGYERDHRAPKALTSSIYFAAVCSLDELQCQSLLGTDKKSSMAFLQGQAESELRKADFLVSDDMTVLQAHVILLVR